MGNDRGDSFPFDFEPNGFPFGSKSKGKLVYIYKYKLSAVFYVEGFIFKSE